MTKESKNLLTREVCKKELIRWAKGEMLHNIVLLGIMLLIFVPLLLLSVYIAKHVLVFGIIFALICTVAPIIFVCRIICDMIKIRLVKRGSFSIVKDTVCRISKEETPKKYSEGRRTVDVIYFTKYERCTSLVTPFDLSCVGDEFYLVILHTNTNKDQIVFAYHSMMYECKDMDMASIKVTS